MRGCVVRQGKLYDSLYIHIKNIWEIGPKVGVGCVGVSPPTRPRYEAKVGGGHS